MNSSSDHNCLFCKIVAGDIPADVVYEDDHTVAFLDIKPVNHGHTLIISKEHHRNIFDTPPETLQQVISTAQKVAKAIQSALDVPGVNIHMNNEPEAGQVIFHTHLHVIPRTSDDNLELWHGRSYAEDGASVIAKKIQQALM